MATWLILDNIIIPCYDAYFIIENDHDNYLGCLFNFYKRLLLLLLLLLLLEHIELDGEGGESYLMITTKPKSGDNLNSRCNLSENFK